MNSNLNLRAREPWPAALRMAPRYALRNSSLIGLRSELPSSAPRNRKATHARAARARTAPPTAHRFRVHPADNDLPSLWHNTRISAPLSRRHSRFQPRNAFQPNRAAIAPGIAISRYRASTFHALAATRAGPATNPSRKISKPHQPSNKKQRGRFRDRRPESNALSSTSHCARGITKSYAQRAATTRQVTSTLPSACTGTSCRSAAREGAHAPAFASCNLLPVSAAMSPFINAPKQHDARDAAPRRPRPRRLAAKSQS